jgi:hypothetical protein
LRTEGIRTGPDAAGDRLGLGVGPDGVPVVRDTTDVELAVLHAAVNARTATTAAARVRCMHALLLVDRVIGSANRNM